MMFSFPLLKAAQDCVLTRYFTVTKAKLMQEGIFFLMHLFARDVIVMKKLEIEKN